MAPFSRLLPMKPFLLHRHIYTAPLSNKQKVQNALSLLKSEKLNSAKEILNICHAATEFNRDNDPLYVKSSSLSGKKTSKEIYSLLQDLKTQPSLLSSFLHELKNREDLQNEPFFCYSITLYGQAGMLYHAILTFEEMVKQGIYPSTKSLNALLSVTLHLDKGFAHEYFSSFRKIHGIKRFVDTYNHPWGFQKSLFFTILGEMESKGCGPDNRTFNIILAALYKEEKNAAKLVDFMDKNKLPLNVSIYNFGIASLCKQRKPMEAKVLFNKLSSRGMKPNADSYGHLIRAFGDVRNLGQLEWLIINMHEGGGPYRNCYEALVEHLEDEDVLQLIKVIVLGFISKSKYEDLKEMMEMMEHIRFRPVLPICNFTIQVLCELMNTAVTKQVFEKMLSGGIKPNIETYHHLFRAFRWIGDLEEIKRLSNNMRGNGVEPDGFCYKIINECLPHGGNSDSSSQASDKDAKPDISFNGSMNKCTAEDEFLFQAGETVVGPSSSCNKIKNECLLKDGSSGTVLQAGNNQVSKKRFRSVPLASNYTDYESLPSHLIRSFKAEEAREDAGERKERYTKIVNLLMEIKESFGEKGMRHDCLNVACCLLSFGTCYHIASSLL